MTAQAGDTFLLKRTQRRDLRRLRALIPAHERRRAAERAARQALQWLRVRPRRTVAVYLSAGSELDTQPLIAGLRHAGHRVCVPVVLPNAGLRFVELAPSTRLRRNHLGICEPETARAPIRHAQLDAILMPLVGFDHEGRRLGAGGGYYDRYLARPRRGKRPQRIGYAFAMQGVERLPDDPWDIRLDAIITERGIRLWPTG